MAKAFLAQFNTVCPGCGDDIVAYFDEIVMTDAGAQHVDCAPVDDGPELVTFPL